MPGNLLFSILFRADSSSEADRRSSQDRRSVSGSRGIGVSKKDRWAWGSMLTAV